MAGCKAGTQTTYPYNLFDVITFAGASRKAKEDFQCNLVSEVHGVASDT